MHRETIIENLRKNQVNICEKFTSGQCLNLLLLYKGIFPQSISEKLEITLNNKGVTCAMIELTHHLINAYSHQIKKFCEFIINENINETVAQVIFSFDINKFKEWLYSTEMRMDIYEKNNLEEIKEALNLDSDGMNMKFKSYYTQILENI